MTKEINWRQVKNNLIINYPNGEIYFRMPKEWKLKDTHKDLIVLAEYLLFSPFCDTGIANHKFTRKKGKAIGLAFSGGVDSTAAMELLKPLDVKLVYHQREGFLQTSMKQDNALLMIKKMKEEVIKIKSNQEFIPESLGKRRGFSTDYCAGIGIVLMADMLDLGYFASGQMMESTHLRRGYKFRNFESSKFWLTFEPLFKLAGLEILGPVFGCSEVITSQIVEQTEYDKLAQSCVRGTSGKGCNGCYKCYRKNVIKGINPKFVSGEVQYLLGQRPLKQAASLIYSMNKYGMKIKGVEEYSEMKLEFIGGHYDPILDLLPIKIRKVVKKNLKKFGIKSMTKKQIINMKEFDISK